MITIGELLNKLPEGYRELALENAKDCLENEIVPMPEVEHEIAQALYQGFIWANSPECLRFWLEVVDAIEGKVKYPPIPVVESEVAG